MQTRLNLDTTSTRYLGSHEKNGHNWTFELGEKNKITLPSPPLDNPISLPLLTVTKTIQPHKFAIPSSFVALIMAG